MAISFQILSHLTVIFAAWFNITYPYFPTYYKAEEKNKTLHQTSTDHSTLHGKSLSVTVIVWKTLWSTVCNVSYSSDELVYHKILGSQTLNTIQNLPLRISTCFHGTLDTNCSAAAGVEHRRKTSFAPVTTSTYSTTWRAFISNWKYCNFNIVILYLT